MTNPLAVLGKKRITGPSEESLLNFRKRIAFGQYGSRPLRKMCVRLFNGFYPLFLLYTPHRTCILGTGLAHSARRSR